MNILFLDQFSDLGGAQQVLLELLPAVRARGWRAVVGLPGDGKLVGAVRDLGLEVERIAGWSSTRQFISKTLPLALQIRALAMRTNAGLLYLNGPRLLPAAVLSGVSCPVLFHSHSWLSEGNARAAAGLSLWCKQARVVANCEFVAKQWWRYVRADRISTILNGVPGPAEMPPRRRNGPPRIGCLGRIDPRKGQREFVAAAARIHESLPECRFAVYGEAMFGDSNVHGYAAEVRRAAAGLPIEFSGWVTDVYGALAELDLLLVPSLVAEATTRVIPEAYAAGVPVIAFDCGGIPEVVRNGVTGILTRSVEEMARESVALLSGDPERRQSMARAARAEWERRFTLPKFHEALLAVMEEWARSK
jgi:glycosyltransferase involved in cell wall biosynthesis